jgi:hypothetical protein
VSRVQVQGFQTDARTAAMVTEAQKLGGPLRITQGSYSRGVAASAGTHDGGGVIDFSVRGLTLSQINRRVKALRQVGFAAWHRLPAEGPWSAHLHAVAVGCPDLAPLAAGQVESLRRGRNGLRGQGLDRHRGLGVKVTTWEAYKRARDAAKADGWKAYKVRAGDTLTAIAERHDTTVDKLVKRNRMKDPDHLSVGQLLEVPR